MNQGPVSPRSASVCSSPESDRSAKEFEYTRQCKSFFRCMERKMGRMQAEWVIAGNYFSFPSFEEFEESEERIEGRGEKGIV